jgi:dCMP deaminase
MIEEASYIKLLKWDKYFYGVCEEVSKQSSCLSRHIGAVLVEDNTIICEGYNGPPRGVPHCNERYEIDTELKNYLKVNNIKVQPKDKNRICPRYVMGYKSGEGLQWCIAGHAERNALINAARLGIRCKGLDLYMSCGVPCTPCLVEIINAGIRQIVITDLSFYDTSSKYLLMHSNLSVRIFSHLCKHENALQTQGFGYCDTLNRCPDCGMYLEE